MFVFIFLVSFFLFLVNVNIWAFIELQSITHGMASMCIYTTILPTLAVMSLFFMPLRHNINTYVCACEQKCSIRLCYYDCVFSSSRKIFILILRLLDDDAFCLHASKHNILDAVVVLLFLLLSISALTRIKKIEKLKKQK